MHARSGCVGTRSPPDIQSTSGVRTVQGQTWSTATHVLVSGSHSATSLVSPYTVLFKLGQKASSAWNISGDPCTGVATDATNIDDNPNFNPGIKCECTDQNNTVCHVTKLTLGTNALTGSVPKELGNLTNLVLLGFGSNNLNGSLPSELGDLVKLKHCPLPATLSNLVQLTNLRIGDIVNGSSSLEFISNMTSLSTLFLGNNSLSRSLPSSIGPSLKNLDFSYNQLSGNFHSWITLNNMQLVLPSGLECLQRNTPCFLGRPQSSSFAVDCGSTRSVSGSDTLMYQSDDAKLGAASYIVTGTPTWGVSNVGTFLNAPNGSYTIYSSRQFQNTLDPELFQTARMSPSSLRYYGVGLENGNYTVTLQFAEFDYEDSQTWKSVGRRVFDIYIQGERKEQNFDIRKAAGGKSYTTVKKQYTIPVTRNFLEIHLFWAGKGTCCIPAQGYYGPAISALSATPNLLADFTPTVRNATQKKSNSKTGVIVGMVVGAAVLGLVALAGLCMWRQKKRKLSLEQQELYSIVGRPNVFSYSELRTATESFSSNNLLGEGGYGSVYKGTLTDGRVVAVKQLSETSHQGKKEFATEIETISRVQHRNLVKLFGCCLEGNKPLLVYEYLENGSLDKALFGTKRSNLDWPTRFDICLCIGRGLAYLHEESSIRVVHRDIKASNVLLDANLNPKISDFGLAKLYDDKKTHVSTKVAGTFGYLAPEYAMRGYMSEKIDVFAFGVVVLETLAGRPNFDNTLDEDKVYILEWVWQLYEEKHPLDVVDPKLTEFNADEVLRAIHVALLCTQGVAPPASVHVAGRLDAYGRRGGGRGCEQAQLHHRVADQGRQHRHLHEQQCQWAAKCGGKGGRVR
ncbi:hypothetical protein PR202_gb14387 [Eleusine coracana subsp. coracana]|uniref:non-specific serine/threonine protein kinase n=1 Tax=Eleusine coracana subsp. coracana TaxID=191504 RepID=A0AAV5EV44_ELECO|nr:hypothetical protein PR202_gb14387 [Eleusine coracana subsp. coracana]